MILSKFVDMTKKTSLDYFQSYYESFKGMLTVTGYLIEKATKIWYT